MPYTWNFADWFDLVMWRLTSKTPKLKSSILILKFTVRIIVHMQIYHDVQFTKFEICQFEKLNIWGCFAKFVAKIS